MSLSNDAKHFVKQIEDIDECSFECHQEKDAYTQEQYETEQNALEKERHAQVHGLHEALFRARHNGWELSPDYVMYLEDSCTGDGKDWKNPNYGKCLICGGKIENGIHEDTGQTFRYAYPEKYRTLGMDIIM